MASLLLGLDIGTTSAKGIILTPDGRIVAEAASSPYPLSQPQPGWVEQNPEDWWRAACTVIRNLCKQVGGSENIAGVAVSGQGCACVLIDRYGTVLRPAIIWMDTRAATETATMAARWGEQVLQLNGNAVGVYNVEPKLLWLRTHEPEIYARTHYTLTTTAYINWKLTGCAMMNFADGGILFAYDAKQKNWSQALLEEMGIRSDLYPPLAACTSVIGTITAQAGQECGLVAGTPVVAGGEDSPAAALSVGVCEPGDAFLSLGTAAVVGLCVHEKHDIREPHLLTYPHVLSELTIISGSMSSAGAAIEWLLREFGAAYEQTGEKGYGGLNSTLDQSQPGANGIIFLPYLSGELHPILDPHARGVFFGLSLGSTRADIAQAVLEGSAMAIRHNVNVAQQAGATLKQLYASGGPTRSPQWCQIIADVLGQPLNVVESAGAPVGDALLAGVGTGHITDIALVARSMVSAPRTYTARAQYKARYDHMYETYIRLYEHLAADFSFMAACP